jgi:ribonuclease HII
MPAAAGCVERPQPLRLACLRARVGVDEAGRGCVVGPLFVAAAAFTDEALARLRAAGVRDSKALTRRRREELEPLIRAEALALSVRRVEPQVIDQRNLNEAELEAIAAALSEVRDRLQGLGVEVGSVAVDLFGRREELSSLIGAVFPGAEARLLHGADALLAECSAASIIAKVERDRHLDRLREAYGVLGSGYPSDPETRRWLASIASLSEPPPCLRRSWRTLLKYAPGLHVGKRGLKAGKAPKSGT